MGFEPKALACTKAALQTPRDRRPTDTAAATQGGVRNASSLDVRLARLDDGCDTDCGAPYGS